MRTFRQRVSVRNPQTDQALETDALVDTGSTLTVLTRAQMAQLGVEAPETRSFGLANGQVVYLSAGYAEVAVGARAVVTLCAFGDVVAEPILGATALELLFLAVDPVRKALVPMHGLLM